MRKLLVVTLPIALMGCQMDQQAQRQMILSQQSQNCSDYGFTKGTDAFATCMQNGINQRRQAAQLAAAAVFANRPSPLTLPQIQAPQPVRPTNCTSTAIGTQIYTNCY